MGGGGRAPQETIVVPVLQTQFQIYIMKSNNIIIPYIAIYWI